MLSGSNKYKRVLTAIAVILLLPITGFAQEKQVSEIKVTGNDHVTFEAIMTATGLKTGTAFTEDVVQQAKQSIEGMGYFQPGVTAGVENVDSGVRLVFNVVEYPVVKDIKITGNTVLTTEKLRSTMFTQVNGVLNMNTLRNKDIASIEDSYAKLGYLAYVTEDAGIDPDTGVLKIPIVEVKVHAINITGNKKTNAHVILREMDTKVGHVYNELTLAKDIQRIYDMGIFELEGTGIEPPKVGPTLDTVDLTIPVKEKKTGEVSVGLGYSSKQKLVGQAKASDNNFRGRGQTVNFMWDQGSGGPSYEAGFYEPWLDSRHTSFGINLYDKLLYRFSNNFLGAQNTGGDTNYDERRKGGNITLSRPFGKVNRGFLTARSESVVSGLINNPSAISSDGTINSVTSRLTNDARDSVVDPYIGGYNSYAVELGTAAFTTEAHPASESTFFSKYSFDVRRYFSKGGARKELTEQRRRIAFRLMAGSLTGNVPFFEQYFLGGSETLRGYQEDRFWGKNMVLASGEYRIPVAQSLTGVVFVDYGDAWGAVSEFRTPDLLPGFPQHENFRGNLGYGLGIRVITPIGPLRLDYGFGKEGSRAHFSIGNAF